MSQTLNEELEKEDARLHGESCVQIAIFKKLEPANV